MSHEVSLTQRAWDSLQFFLCLGVLCLLLVYLLMWPGRGGQVHAEQAVVEQRDVSVAGHKSVAIRPDSPIYRRLDIITVNRTETTEPIVTATGVNVASLQARGNGGDGDLHDFWQFYSTDLLTAFADWQRTDAEIEFAEKQLEATIRLAEATVEAQRAVVARLERLVQIGTDTPSDLAEARAELIQAEIEGQREVHEAQAELRLARQEKAVLARQLTLEGLPPDLIVSITRDVDIVRADVPESMIRQVQVGQRCVARFFSYPELKFYGRVLSIVPVLSQELRSLRVLFAIDDAEDMLRPGMFAEIGLGIDPRLVLHIPPESIISTGGLDYVLVRQGDSDWRVTAVQLGELRESGIEVHGGLEDGDQVIGRGAILLKPLIVESLRVR